MRIAVLGAGIVGLSAAEWLRRDGHAVTLIDRLSPGDPGQTSHGNAGILAAPAVVPVPVPGLIAKVPGLMAGRSRALFLRWGHVPRLLPWLVGFLASGRLAEVERISRALAPLIGDTLDEHRRLAAGTGAERHIRPGGYTYLFPDRADCEADRLGARLRREAGIEAETLDRAALLAQDPHLGPAYSFGLRFAGAGHLDDPAAYSRALFAHFRARGGGFLQGEIDDIAPTPEGVSVRTGGETQAFERAVIATGVWSERLARRLGHRTRLEAERGYHLVLERPNRQPPVAYMMTDAKCAVTPMAGGLRFAGLVEFAGLTDARSRAPTAQQRRLARRLYPDLTWEGEQVWMGRRPSTTDSLPLIGPSPRAPRISFAVGHQHLGLTAGPRTGRLIADLIAGRRPNIDLAPYRVGRFDR